MSNWNDNVISQFRATGGTVNGFGRSLVLLHHVGAKSGTERVNPLAYQDLGGGTVAVFASKGGAPTNPDWYHNLLANPKARIETGTETRDVVARVAEGEERERIWTRQKELMPGFADYERTTKRQIPVIILEPLQG